MHHVAAMAVMLIAACVEQIATAGHSQDPVQAEEEGPGCIWQLDGATHNRSSCNWHGC